MLDAALEGKSRQKQPIATLKVGSCSIAASFTTTGSMLARTGVSFGARLLRRRRGAAVGRLGSCSCLPAHKLHTAAASILFGHINAAYLRSNTDLKVLSTCVQPGRCCPPATPSHAPPSAHPSVEHHPPTYLHQRLLPQAQSFQLSSAGPQRSTNLRSTSIESARLPPWQRPGIAPLQVFMYHLQGHAASKHFDRRWMKRTVLDGICVIAIEGSCGGTNDDSLTVAMRHVQQSDTQL